MSLAISSLKPPHSAFSLSSQTRLYTRTRNVILPFRSSSIRSQSLIPKRIPNSLRLSSIGLGFPPIGRNLGFRARAENGEDEREREREREREKERERERTVDRDFEEARKNHSTPDRFRYLMKEAPDPPLRWPWFVALAFLLYAWRSVLWELSNWKTIAARIVQFVVNLVGYILKLAVALIFHFIGDPITSTIRGIETVCITVEDFYTAVVEYTPIPELITIIMLVSAILAIAEAAVPDSVESQPYLLTTAGIIGFAAVKGFISELYFWMLLVGLFGFARFVKKRDYVSSLLPVAAALTAVGEAWVRVLAMTSYMALAIVHHSKKPSKDIDEGEAAVTGEKVPIPLLCAALAIGVRVAAKWVAHRHSTWKIV
ncbi:Phospholipase [Actinidia chinensis var. chinensis]|uniref:Phospholipase n=1 Tax=Actinidia chinensis var. chinensis TaxID=1590841 RepID=A0A2R6QTL0_ACTCC|nr:Phospholipase [Actinidia chinensis var. chinensis]